MSDRHGDLVPTQSILSYSDSQQPWRAPAIPMISEQNSLTSVSLWSDGPMLAKRRSCNESATQQRILASTTIRRTWWVFIDLKLISASDIFNSLNLPQRYFIYYKYLPLCWPYISARDTRYQSAVRIQEQPPFYLPWFSWIWNRRQEATAGSNVVFEEESQVEGSKRSAACYLVSFTMISAYILALMISSVVKGFVSFWTVLGLYCHWKRPSLRQRELEKVSIAPSFKFQSPV